MSEETFKYKTSPIAEMQGGIVLARFEKPERRVEEYQTESQLEENMINNLVSQGYERLDVRPREVYRKKTIYLKGHANSRREDLYIPSYELYYR